MLFCEKGGYINLINKFPLNFLIYIFVDINRWTKLIYLVQSMYACPKESGR